MLYEDYEDKEEKEDSLLKKIKDKRKKSRTKEINVMNKKKLSKWELDEYMVDIDTGVDEDTELDD